jgi:P27 family predicted phage terminase small subunit
MLVLQRRTRRSPRPPEHLSDEMKSWWKQVVKVYELESHHLRLLQCACESWDRSQEARRVLVDEGLTVVDNRGITRAHPCASVELQNRKSFQSALRELGLDVAQPSAQPRRPPNLPAYRVGRDDATA